MKGFTKQRVFAIVVGLLMASSVIGIVFVNYGTENRDVLTYKKYEFVRDGSSLVTQINGKPVPFTYFPKELESIQLNQSIADRIKNTRLVYATSDYHSNNSQVIASVEYDLARALDQNYGIYVIQGFTQNVSKLPVVSCRNATGFVPVISFEEGNDTAIFERDNCIIVQANDFNGFVKARDRLLYGIFGVIQ